MLKPFYFADNFCRSAARTKTRNPQAASGERDEAGAGGEAREEGTAWGGGGGTQDCAAGHCVRWWLSTRLSICLHNNINPSHSLYYPQTAARRRGRPLCWAAELLRANRLNRWEGGPRQTRARLGGTSARRQQQPGASPRAARGGGNDGWAALITLSAAPMTDRRGGADRE